MIYVEILIIVQTDSIYFHLYAISRPYCWKK